MYRILPWSRGDLLQAVLDCQLSGLRLQGGGARRGEPSESELRRKLVAYLNDGIGFIELADGRPTRTFDTIVDAAGYIGTDSEAGWVYLTAEKVNSIIGTGRNAASLKRRLQDEGHLGKAKQGGFVVQRKIYAGGKGNENFAWVYAFSPALLEE
jgi:hypothetical protein